MARTVTTLFIRDNSINLLVMKGRQIEKWASLLLEPGLVSQGLILNEAQVAGKVEELFKLEGVTTRKIITGLSGLNSIYRMITLPKLPEAIIPEAIKHEASRVMPVSLDEIYLSYQLTPAPEDELSVFLAAYPRNTADALLRTLRQAGLEPYLMDLAPLALCRIPDEPRAIIVNARLEHLGIMVIEDRLPQLIRRLSLPSEAESLSEKLPIITDEFSRTVAFYNSSHLEKPLDSTVPVFINGELAEAPETWQSIVNILNSPVSLLPLPVESPEGFSPNDFMVNIGLALKELLPENREANFSLVNLNALPEAYLPKALPVVRILTRIGIVAGIGLLAYMGFLIQSSSGHIAELHSQLELTESRTNQQYKEIATLKEQIKSVEAQIEPVEAQIEPVEATTGVFNTTLTSLEEGREQANGDLVQIVMLLPLTSINLTEVNYTGSSVTVNGISPDEDDIFKYARALRARGRFPVVIISSITEYIIEVEEEEIRQFRFQLTLR